MEQNSHFHPEVPRSTGPEHRVVSCSAPGQGCPWCGQCREWWPVVALEINFWRDPLRGAAPHLSQSWLEGLPDHSHTCPARGKTKRGERGQDVEQTEGEGSVRPCRLLQQITADWVARQQQRFLPLSSGGKSKIKAPANSECGKGSAFCCVLTWWKGPGTLWGLFFKGTDPILITSQRPHLQILSRWGLGFNIRTLGGHRCSVCSRWLMRIKIYQ